jgi:hypothetical protein
MFAIRMHVEQWQDRADIGATIRAPTWQQVESAILALDDRSKTGILLSADGNCDNYMIVAGNRSAGYMVNATDNNWDFCCLVDPARSTTKRVLYVGGQDGEYPENKLVPLEWALEAAKHYLETGERKPSMNWVSDY